MTGAWSRFPVHLLDSSQSGDAFIQLHELPGDEQIGQTIHGVTFWSVQELGAPKVVEYSAVVQATVYDDEARRERTGQLVSWRRGPVVGSVFIQAIDQEDRTPALERLARKMDERIATALAGGE